MTFGRTFVAALAVLAVAWLLGTPLGFGWAEAPRFALYGLITAAHFLLYIWSLDLTTIAHSLSIVYTAPVFVTLFSALLLGERIAPRRYLGMPVVVAGVALLTGFDPAVTERGLLGDLLALGSAITFGLYSVAGRRERERQPLLRYAGGVYGAAALWLLPFAALAWGGWRGLGPAAAIVALGIFPLGLGHTLYNASLRRVHPTYVNMIATLEVVGGVLLGAIVLGEVPPPIALFGAAVVLGGIGLVLLPGRKGET